MHTTFVELRGIEPRSGDNFLCKSTISKNWYKYKSISDRSQIKKAAPTINPVMKSRPDMKKERSGAALYWMYIDLDALSIVPARSFIVRDSYSWSPVRTYRRSLVWNDHRTTRTERYPFDWFCAIAQEVKSASFWSASCFVLSCIAITRLCASLCHSFMI